MDLENNQNLNPVAPEAQAAPKTAPDAPPETPGNTTQEQIKAIVSKYKQGMDLTSEDAYNSALLELLQGFDNLQEKFMVAINNDPDFGAALDEILNGEDVRTALARNYGPDAFTAVEGDPDFEKMNENLLKGKEKMTKRKETAEMIAKNQEMSMQEIKAWLEEKSFSDEEAIARMKKYQEIREDFLNDKLTRKHLELIDKAMDFDTAVAQATEEGKVAGRNEQIVNRRQKESLKSDGLPQVGNTASTPPPAPAKRSLLAQLRDENKSN